MKMLKQIAKFPQPHKIPRKLSHELGFFEA